MNHLYFSDYNPKTNPEFATRWPIIGRTISIGFRNQNN